MKKININLALVFITISGFVYAQEVEEIIVTANKSQQTVQEIPMNISVLTDVDIEERGISNPEDYLRTLAGVSTPGGDAFFIIRGLNTSAAQRNSGTTNVYTDEVNMSLVNIFDIERIELLRGPQGTLYGSNAIGGTLRYITKKPDPSGFDTSVEMIAGSKKFASKAVKNLNAMVNVPLSDNTALRVVSTSSFDPGIYQNVMTGNKSVGDERDEQLTATLGYADGPLSLMFRYSEKSRKDNGVQETGNSSKPGSADIYDPNCTSDLSYWYNWDGLPNCSRVASIADYLGVDISGYNPLLWFADAADEIGMTDSEMFVTTINYDFDMFTATLVSSSREIDEFEKTEWGRIDMDDLYSAPLYNVSTDERDTLELRLASKPGTIEWVVGYYKDEQRGLPGNRQDQFGMTDEAYDYIANVIMGWTGSPPTEYVPWQDYNPGYPGWDNSRLYYGFYSYGSYADEEAIFGQITYNLENWEFSAGIRDYEISDGYKSENYGVFYGGEYGCDDPDQTGPDGISCAEESGSESDSRPKFTASYTPNEDLTFFAVSSAGYRSGGNNSALPYFCSEDPEASATFNRRYTSDKAENTEFGVKARGDGFSINATYFHIDWSDIQIIVSPACGWSYYFNGAEATSEGIELDFSYTLADNLFLDFTGSSMTAETNTDIPSLGAAKGDRLPNTVEQQYNIGLTYEYSSPLMGLSSFIRADYLYYGDSFATFGQSEDMFSPDYSKLNINWGMEIDENNSIQISVDNATDERTEAFKYAVSSPSWRPRDYMQWIPPRSITFAYRYNY
ncbi:MAG: TonB-dependent receptor [Gammaproteobacteria bacterium]|tara:strand:- start:2674 stop:5040 length:2367 start_codon:yes stop_codon:yes gene_type:complete